MTPTNAIMVGAALLAMIIAAVLSAVDAALQAISPSRAERMLAEGQPGAAAVKEITDDPAPELTAATFLRVLCEVAAVVLVSLVVVANLKGLGAQLGLSIGAGLLHRLGGRPSNPGPAERRTDSWPRGSSALDTVDDPVADLPGAHLDRERHHPRPRLYRRTVQPGSREDR